MQALAVRQSFEIPRWLTPYVAMSSVLWVMLWFGIDSGPWVLRRTPGSLIGWAHYARTLFPFIVIAAALVWVRQSHWRLLGNGPLLLWFWYGVVALAATIDSPLRFEDSLYWAICYLSAFAGILLVLREGDPLDRARDINHVSWAVTTIFLAIMLFLARDYLLASAGTAYQVRRGVGETAVGMEVSRSTGMARFAAIPGIIGFTMLLAGTHRAWRVVGLVMFAGALYLIYLFQARTATFGFAAALAVVMILLGQRTRILGIALACVAGCLLLNEVIPSERVDGFLEHIFRGDPGGDSVRTFGGRLRPWRNAWAVSAESPIWGFGHLADRVLLGELVHNTYFYALLTAGWAGTLLFVTGLAWIWMVFIRVVRHVGAVARDYYVTAVQAGAVLTFFTMRSVTELSGVHYSVDTLLLVAAAAYLILLDRHVQGSKACQTERTFNEVTSA